MESVDNHSVPTMCKEFSARWIFTRILKQVMMKAIFTLSVSVMTAIKKHEGPHSKQVSLCIISAQVMHATCTCASGKVNYCNHTLALMLKIWKYSLFERKTTEDLDDELAENPSLACTSTLQTSHKRYRGDSIHPQPVMDLVVAKIKHDDEQSGKAISWQLYEARKKKLIFQRKRSLKVRLQP